MFIIILIISIIFILAMMALVFKKCIPKPKSYRKFILENYERNCVILYDVILKNKKSHIYKIIKEYISLNYYNKMNCIKFIIKCEKEICKSIVDRYLKNYIYRKLYFEKLIRMKEFDLNKDLTEFVDEIYYRHITQENMEISEEIDENKINNVFDILFE